MSLYSYVVARDFGFAPNPFLGVCTLATCKPNIRRKAKVGDWVIGTGTATRKRSGYLVYAMKVDETLSFEDYWSDPKFLKKRPSLRSSKMRAFGDNIYRRDTNGRWIQLESHHSHADGSPNLGNIRNDTSANRVLIGYTFVYFGGGGPKIPAKFRNWAGTDLCARRGHKVNFPEKMEEAFVGWVKSLNRHGCVGDPLDWDRSR